MMEENRNLTDSSSKDSNQKNILDNIAHIFGKLIDKLPINKLTPGMTFVAIVDIIFVLPLLICLILRHVSTDIVIIVFLLIFFQTSPIIIIETLKSLKSVNAGIYKK